MAFRFGKAGPEITPGGTAGPGATRGWSSGMARAVRRDSVLDIRQVSRRLRLVIFTQDPESELRVSLPKRRKNLTVTGRLVGHH